MEVIAFGIEYEFTSILIISENGPAPQTFFALCLNWYDFISNGNLKLKVVRFESVTF